MRAFVFLLILANLLFLAWTHGYFGSSSDPDALRVQQQLLADQVKVISRDDPPTELIKTDKAGVVAEKKAVDICILLRDLPNAELVRVESLLAEKKLAAFKAERTMIAGSASYWVFMPPLANKQEADSKAAELKKLGVPEFFVVQETGPNNLTISLGLFSSKEAANARLDMLRTKGVKTAKVAERAFKTISASLEIYGPEAQADLLRQTVAEAMPEIKPEVCKPPVAAQ
ncbi:SPOR domain-containing protein [Propionivibrio sp.]|uniref:SPOR domain-containing protein n=1 Tax=Propionivibrio sp. TaxID=2212460 RepID=UPI003BF3B9FC